MRLRHYLLLALAFGAGAPTATLQAQIIKRAVPVEDDTPTAPPVPPPPAGERLVTPIPPPVDAPPKLTPPKALPVLPVAPLPEAKPMAKPATKVEDEEEKPKPKKPVQDTTLPDHVAPMKLKAQAVEDDTKPGEEEKPVKKNNLPASVKTNTNARSIIVTVAGPRGQVVDRNGVPLAQNKIVNYLALNFPTLPTDDRNAIIAFGRGKMNEANRRLGATWDLPDDRLVSHYKDRRWLPLIFAKSGEFAAEISEDQAEKLKPLLGKGLMLVPTYQRYYPQNDCACHIIGYTGRARPLPMGPIIEGEPSIEEPAGRSGIEAAFEERLRGKPAKVNKIFAADGTMISEEYITRGEPGENVVLSIDFNIQKYAENALKRGAEKGGAMVILDVRNGDILAMASNPGYDLNDFIPLRQSYYDKLLRDPLNPLLPRAYGGDYFPASTFKVITALAGLESGSITPNTTFDCANAFTIGDHTFHNWNKEGEGPMNVVGAIKRSCNTWFYQAGLATGAVKIMDMARRMGFGQAVGLPISGEHKGSLPSDETYMHQRGTKILAGDLASMSIGQIVEVTPLQAARCMATVADGRTMPLVRLVKQIQDYNDNVTVAYEPNPKDVKLMPMARDTVVKGMIAVVNGEGGTGKKAGLDNIQVAGKTGTAQWKVYPDKEKCRNLAWFTGFLPASNPIYAFALVYEGAPGEGVSGGSKAAPIVHEVFTNLYKSAPTDDPLILAAKSAPKAEVDDDGPKTGGDDNDGEVRKGQPAPETPPPPEEKKGIGNFFRSLFKR